MLPSQPQSGIEIPQKSNEALQRARSSCDGQTTLYGAAMKVVSNADRQETSRWINNRVENSHLPF